MGEIMTMEEIKVRFPGEWVFIEEPETTPSLRVLGGRVAWHGVDYESLCQARLASNSKSAATLHTSAEADETAYWL